MNPQHRKTNPAKAIVFVGMLTIAVLMAGGLIATGGEIPVPTSLGWTVFGVGVLTVFIASVVGAYYSGKGKS